MPAACTGTTGHQTTVTTITKDLRGLLTFPHLVYVPRYDDIILFSLSSFISLLFHSSGVAGLVRILLNEI